MDLNYIRAYNGTENYIFISYAHRNKNQVLPVIAHLQELGFRIWFDEGIDPGTEWDENIAFHVRNCDYFIAFISKEYLASDNCKDELNYARDLDKERLLIYLENVTLPDGLAMRLNRLQAIHKYSYGNEQDFYEKLLAATGIQTFRMPTERPSQPKEEPRSAPAKTKTKGWLWGGLIAGAILLLTVILIAVFAGGGGTSGPDNGGADSGQGSTENSGPPTMSDQLFDYTFTLEGVVYQLPFSYETLTKNGWALSTPGYNEASPVAGDSYEIVSMVNNGKQITVYPYNRSGNTKALKDCLVGGIEVALYYGTEFSIAKGITPAATADEIIQAFGTPTDRDGWNDSDNITYEQEEFRRYVKFICYTGSEAPDSVSCILLRNFVKAEGDETEINPERPAYLNSYQAPTSLGTDLTVPILSVDGDLYCLPAPVSAFLERGWTAVSQPGSIVSGGSEYITIARNGYRLDLSVYNFAEYMTTPENCAVTALYLYGSDESLPPIFLPGNLGIGSTESEVKAVLSEEFQLFETSPYRTYSYGEFETRQYTLDLTLDTATGKLKNIDISCRAWKD